MNFRTVFFVLAATCFGSAASAHSYDDGPRGDHRHGRIERCDYARPWVHERHHRPHYRTGGAGPCHDIHRGDRLPRFYWSDRYHVGDWRYHDLPRPWHRHHWVRVGHDYVMVSRETGRVARVILMRHRR